MSRFLTSCLVVSAALFATAACASAQNARPLADLLAPPAMERVGVRAPDDLRLPVRLEYAPSGQDRAEVWIDVLRADSPRAAAARAEQLAGTAAAAGLAPRDDLGDRAWGDRGLVVLVRGSTVVSVRVLAGAHDAVAIGRRVIGALDRAPGASGATPRLRLEGQPTAEVPARVAFDGEVLAAHVVADGGAYARRAPEGWVVVRSGDGPFEVRAWVVGPDLRVSEVTLASP